MGVSGVPLANRLHKVFRDIVCAMPQVGIFQSALPMALSYMLLYLTASPLLSHAQNPKISHT
jgi:hypothetical protein